MAVIMMAAGLSACSQSNAGLEGKSGIVKDEDSKTESDTGVVDQTPATYVQDAEYVNKDDIVSVDDTIEINGITYKIEKYEHTTEFGNRNKDTVLDYLKDLYGEAIDDNYKPVMCHSCKILRQTFFQVTYLNQSSQIINFQVT